MVNLMSNDVARFDTVVLFLHYCWVGPVQTVMVVYLTSLHLGVHTLAGAATMLVFLPLQSELRWH